MTRDVEMLEDSEPLWIIDLIGAIICGSLLGYVLVAMSDDGVSLGALIKPVLFAVGAYSVIAFLLLLKGKRKKGKIPDWILIALLGALVGCLGLTTIYNELTGWHFRGGLSPVQHASDFLLDLARDAIFTTLFFGLPSLLIMGVTHFFGRQVYRIFTK